MRRGGVATLVSADGKVWEGLTPVTEMDVAADTANNALYDPDLKKYRHLRIYCARIQPVASPGFESHSDKF